MEEKIELTSHELFGAYALFNEAGHCIKSDFDSEAEAKQWAIDNGYDYVWLFTEIKPPTP